MMAHGLPGEPGADEVPRVVTEAEQHKLDSYDALVEALQRYVDCDGYDDEIKAQAHAALKAAKS